MLFFYICPMMSGCLTILLYNIPRSFVLIQETCTKNHPQWIIESTYRKRKTWNNWKGNFSESASLKKADITWSLYSSTVLMWFLSASIWSQVNSTVPIPVKQNKQVNLMSYTLWYQQWVMKFAGDQSSFQMIINSA